jgi:molybdopterin synthase sulfur carrier subunit
VIRVCYFASLREQLGLAEEPLELPAGVADVAGLRARLRARGGVWADALAESRPVLCAVNQVMARPDQPVADGDEVAFFPPVTGG